MTCKFKSKKMKKNISFFSIDTNTQIPNVNQQPENTVTTLPPAPVTYPSTNVCSYFIHMTYFLFNIYRFPMVTIHPITIQLNKSPMQIQLQQIIIQVLLQVLIFEIKDQTSHIFCTL
jgi:hypothetical protein